MKRKLAALVTGVVLAATALSGCGAGDAVETGESASSENTEDTNASKAADTSSEGEIVEIFWQFPSANEVTEAFYRMEDALDEMMEKDIGVHVTFIPTGLMESQQDATLMVSSGEQLDIMLTAFTSIGNLVDRGLILPLDDYKLYTLEELEEMFAIVKEGERDGFYMTTP